MSTASAFSGEMYSTRQHSFGSAGAGLLASRSSAHRNAASVLPDPVGAITRVFSPPAIDDHAPACAGVGSVNAPVNHSRVSALNPARASMPAWAPAVLAPSGAGAALLVRDFAGMHPSCLALRTVQPSRRLREAQDEPQNRPWLADGLPCDITMPLRRQAARRTVGG